MEISKQDKIKLIHFLNFVCDYEASKPIEEMDEELIKSCVKVLLELQDKHVKHSPEFIDEQVRKIFRKEETEITEPETVKTNKKQINKKKVWLVAACIAILVALFSIVSFSSERSVVDVLEDFLGTYEFIPFGKEVDVGKESYIKINEFKYYKTIEETVANEKISLLHPKSTTQITDIERIIVFSKNKHLNITYNFHDPNISINIVCDNKIGNEIIDICNEIKTINNTNYYICTMDDTHQVQAYFTHNDNLYTITYTDRDSLIDILENMEEVKYEN